MPTFTGIENYEILLLDSELNITHSKIYPGSSDYRFHYLLATNDGGCLIVGGIRQELGTHIEDIFIQKIMPEDIITGTSEIVLPGSECVQVYPNPFKEILFTKTEMKGLLFNLYNLQGELLLRSSIPVQQHGNINTSDILPGVYIYSISDEMDKNLQSGKLIK
jgi:hypothetical protein